MNTQQPTPTTQGILGYTAVSHDKKETVNENKRIEEVILRRIEAIELQQGVDKRSLAVAKTNIQDAFMWLNRAVFNPQRINL